MFQLTELAQAELLKLCRNCLEAYLKTGQRRIERPSLPELLEKRGAFVTLHSHGELRGCIGVALAISPLYETAQNCAISAATIDPRFPPLTLSELAEVKIEISVLSLLKEVDALESIEIGVHGLMVNHEGRRGLLLPQVPAEHSWDREQFLRQVCRKAGLPVDAWKAGARIESFTAFVFREETPGK
jgi:AmmeMemoRadiSam system protein A